MTKARLALLAGCDTDPAHYVGETRTVTETQVAGTAFTVQATLVGTGGHFYTGDLNLGEFLRSGSAFWYWSLAARVRHADGTLGPPISLGHGSSTSPDEESATAAYDALRFESCSDDSHFAARTAAGGPLETFHVFDVAGETLTERGHLDVPTCAEALAHTGEAIP